MVIWTNYKRKTEAEKFGENFPKPSLTNQLDYEPLSEIIQRFMANGTVPPAATGQVDPADLTTGKSVDEAFAHLEGAETSDMSKVEQAEVLATAQRLVEQLQEAQQAKQSEKSAISAPETQSQKATSTDDLKEGKAE